MRFDQLPSPGKFKGATRLHLDVLKAISFAEISSASTGGKSEIAKELREFLIVAAKHCNGLTKSKKNPEQS